MLEFLNKLADFIKTRPINETIMLGVLLLLCWSTYDRRQQAKESHETFHTVIREHDEREDRQREQLIGLFKDMRTEQKNTTAAVKEVKAETAEVKEATKAIPVAAAAAAAEKPAEQKPCDVPDKSPGLEF